MSNSNFKSGYGSNINPAEIFVEGGKGALKPIAQDLIGGIAKSALESLGLVPRKQRAPSGEIDLSGGVQSLELQLKKAETQVKRLEHQFHQKVVLESKEIYNRQNQAEAQKIAELVTLLRQEAKGIQNQAASLNGELGLVSTEQITAKPGTYHVNFFRWVLQMLKDIKADIIKSRTWLSAFNSKKNKKGYWGMFKKHGTSFSMSAERNVATGGS